MAPLIEITPVVSPPSVSFLRHIAPYFLPCYVFAVSHFVYHFAGGNLAWPLFIAYLINFPYWGVKWGETETNLDIESEKIFQKDLRFLAPLYAFVFCDYVTWVWCLFVVSDTQPPFMPKEHWLFERKI